MNFFSPKLQKLKILLVMLMGYSSLGYAARYSGHARIGVISSTVSYSEPIQEETSNDVTAISSRLYLLGEGVYKKNDEVVVDIRDKYDFFGTSDAALLTFEPKNTLKIRQLAYRQPWQQNRTFYTAGRFSIPEAGIISNDGGSYGYRLSRRLRIAGFLGIAPEDVVSPVSVSAETRGFDGNQGGVYAVYQKENVARMDTMYLVNALAQAPSFELDEFVNHVYFFHQGLMNFGQKHRVSTFLNTDIMPSFSIRQAHITHGFYPSRYRVRSSLTRITAEDYRLKKDIRDDLEPSTLTTLKSKAKYRFDRDTNFDLGLEYGQRAADGLSKTVIEFGATYRKLMKRRLILGAHYGIKNNYLSDDNYLKVSSLYYQNLYSVAASFSMVTENFDSGESVNPTIISLEGSYYRSDKLRGSLSYSMSSAADRSVNTMMLSVAYNIGTVSTSPTRRRAANFEDL